MMGFKRISIISVFLIIISVASLFLVSCTKKEAPTTSETNLPTFTLDELKKYNGLDGNPAYIAVDGIVYDVTNVPQWKNGSHNGFKAGLDLTDEIKNISPHGVSKLKQVPKVGQLVD